MKRYVCTHGYEESEVGAFYMRDEVDVEMARLKAKIKAVTDKIDDRSKYSGFHAWFMDVIIKTDALRSEVEG